MMDTGLLTQSLARAGAASARFPVRCSRAAPLSSQPLAGTEGFHAHVPDQYTFWDLHVAIQDAMGWQDYHLHEFALSHPEVGNLMRIGLPDEEDPYDRGVLPDHELPIAEYFTSLNP